MGSKVQQANVTATLSVKSAEFTSAGYLGAVNYRSMMRQGSCPSADSEPQACLHGGCTPSYLRHVSVPCTHEDAFVILPSNS